VIQTGIVSFRVFSVGSVAIISTIIRLKQYYNPGSAVSLNDSGAVLKVATPGVVIPSLRNGGSQDRRGDDPSQSWLWPAATQKSA
jgi:hypothetical protein